MKIPAETPEREVFDAIFTYLVEKHCNMDPVDAFYEMLAFFAKSLISFIASTTDPSSQVQVLEASQKIMMEILAEYVKGKSN